MCAGPPAVRQPATPRPPARLPLVSLLSAPPVQAGVLTRRSAAAAAAAEAKAAATEAAAAAEAAEEELPAPQAVRGGARSG